MLVLQIRRTRGRCGTVVRSAAWGWMLAGGGARDGRTSRPATIGGPDLADSHRTDLALGSPSANSGLALSPESATYLARTVLRCRGRAGLGWPGLVGAVRRDRAARQAGTVGAEGALVRGAMLSSAGRCSASAGRCSRRRRDARASAWGADTRQEQRPQKRLSGALGARVGPRWAATEPVQAAVGPSAAIAEVSSSRSWRTATPDPGASRGGSPGPAAAADRSARTATAPAREVAGDDGRHVTDVRRPTGQAGEQHAGQRVHVRRRADRPTTQVLGRGVPRRADEVGNGPRHGRSARNRHSPRSVRNARSPARALAAAGPAACDPAPASAAVGPTASRPTSTFAGLTSRCSTPRRASRPARRPPGAAAPAPGPPTTGRRGAGAPGRRRRPAASPGTAGRAPHRNRPRAAHRDGRPAPRPGLLVELRR